MNGINNPIGSIWRKWDLHVHSPASYKYKGTYDQFIDQIEKSNCDVIGINDYCSCEGYKQFKIKNPKSKKVVFPIVEFRMNNALLNKNSKSGQRINFHVIFSNKIKIEDIENFLKSLTVNKTPISSKYSDIQFLYEKVSVDFGKTKDVLEANSTFKDKYLIWMPYDEYGGIDNIDPVNDQWFKQGLINDSHIIGSSNKKQINFFLWDNGKTKEEQFRKWFGDKKPCIKGSDSHRHTYPIGSLQDSKSKPCDKYCWIKADPTFEGLKQVVNEPEDRVFIGKTPSKLIDVKNNKSHYIDSIILKSVDDNRKNPWFDNEIKINPGLIAIIGKKGSGKSALTDSIALVGKSHAKPDTYSFLIGNKFRKKGLAKQYEATLVWCDGVPHKSNLNDQVLFDTEPEQVKYLPQKFVEIVCDEIGINLFQQEIDKVIFSYVPEESRNDTTNLKDLIKLKTGLIDSNIEGLRQKLSEQNELICGLEAKKLPSYLNSLKRKLEEKKRELKNLTKPKKVVEPKSEPSKEIKTKISTLNVDLEEVKKQISKNKEKLKEVNQYITKIQNLIIVLDGIKEKYSEFIKNYQNDLALLEIDPKKLITVRINKTVILNKKKELSLQRDKINKLLSEEVNDQTSLVVRKEKIQIKLKEIYDSLDKENNAYQQYQKELKEYQDKKKLIEGSKNDTSLKTINSLKQEIEYVNKTLDKNIKTVELKRDQIVNQIYDELVKKISFYKEIYSPLGKVISSKKERQKETGSVLDFDVDIIFNKLKFSTEFLNFIDQSRNGSFQGRAEGLERLKEIITSSDLKTKKGVVEFVNELISCLKLDKSEKKQPPKILDNQLIGGESKKLEFYDYLYGLGYLEVKYTITFNGKDLNENEFSPGEIGALLLIFYLLIDKDKIPLIIDQPEENLDNESVFTLLVPYIKQAKKERQIIIVTHNPNLAVVCDAEQVISARMNKQTNEIRYTSGSIENPVINKKILDVLEGTLPAFQKRDHKYFKKIL